MANGEILIDLTSSLPPDVDFKDPPKVIFSAPGYESMEVIPYKGDGTLKSNLGVIPLVPTADALEQDKIKASQLDVNQVKELTKGTKGVDYFTQERLSNQINTIKSTLIPAVLTMISSFGVTKASDLVKQDPSKILDAVNNKSLCPRRFELNDLINKKNKLVKQLNNTLKLIDSTTKALGIAEGVIAILDVTLFTADNTPSNINPFPPTLNKTLSKTIDKIKSTNAGILSILVLLRQVLTQVLQLLNLLDQLVEKCYPDAEQETVALELTILTTEQSNQLSPVVTDVNGFTMGVETEVTNKPLKRRRATATNKKGVVMLKGEWSFSSIDQILIDELVFYIQQNNLKAD